jgi:hypothetical protein
MMLIRTLGLAASDVVAPRDVVLVLGYTALGHLPTILSLSLFWLSRPLPALADHRPIDLARTDVGTREIELLIGRLEHGVVS